MSKTTKTGGSGIFGDLTAIPQAVDYNKLTQFGAVQQSKEDEFIEFQEVEDDLFDAKVEDRFDGGFTDSLEDMFAQSVEEELDSKIADQASGSEGFEGDKSKEDKLGVDSGSSPIGFSLDDMDAEMIFEMVENGRINLHDEIYNYFIYKHPREAKQLTRELSMKDNKTEKEKTLLQNLFDYIDKHDECRAEYLSSVKYSDRHRELLIKFVNYNIQRAAAKGKRMTKTVMWMYILGMEMAPFFALMRIRREIPEFRFDPQTMND